MPKTQLATAQRQLTAHSERRISLQGELADKKRRLAEYRDKLAELLAIGAPIPDDLRGSIRDLTGEVEDLEAACSKLEDLIAAGSDRVTSLERQQAQTRLREAEDVAVAAVADLDDLVRAFFTEKLEPAWATIEEVGEQVKIARGQAGDTSWAPRMYTQGWQPRPGLQEAVNTLRAYVLRVPLWQLLEGRPEPRPAPEVDSVAFR